MSNPFTDHPAAVNETYREHFGFALKFGAKMTFGGLAAMLHAVFPFLFVTTAGKINDELQVMRQNSPGRRKAILGGDDRPRQSSTQTQSRK